MNQIVSGVPKLEIDHKYFCKGCALVNNIKKPFQSSENGSKYVLYLIRSHVFGPIPIIMIRGSFYCVTFTHDSLTSDGYILS